MSISYQIINSKQYIESCEHERSTDRPESKLPLWINITESDTLKILEILQPFDLPKKVIEYCKNKPYDLKLIGYDTCIYFEFPIHTTDKIEDRPYLSVICTPNRLITISSNEVPTFNNTTIELSQYVKLKESNMFLILYYLLRDIIRSNIFGALNDRNKIDKLTDIFDKDPESLNINELFELKSDLGKIATTLEDQLVSTAHMSRFESSDFEINDYIREEYQSLGNNIQTALTRLKRFENRLKDLHEQYNIYIQQKTEGKLKLLTVISGIFLPLTLIAGIYGMNFENMAELSFPYSYPICLSVMALITTGMLIYFKKEGWF